ncbi:MAG: tetratricopeptide repeat protein [Planctomycetaceae bacterium]
MHRLNQPKLPDRLRWELTRELARTFAEHARYMLDDEQLDLRNKATQALEESLPNAAGLDAKLLIEIELGLMKSRRADLILQELDVFPRDDGLQARFRQIADEAVTELNELLQRAESRSRKLSSARNASPSVNPNTDDAFPTPSELRSRISEIRYQLALTLGNRVKFSDVVLAASNIQQRETANEKPKPAASRSKIDPDHIEHLRRATQLLEPLAELDPPDDLIWPARLLTIEYRIWNLKSVEFKGLLNSWESDAVPEFVRGELEVIFARHLMRRGTYDQTLERIIDYRKTHTSLPPELYYWQQKSLVALTLLAKEKQQTALSEELLKESDIQAAQAVAQAGGIWGYRSHMLTEQLHNAMRYGIELAESLQSARLHHRRGEIESAIAEYQFVIARGREGKHVDLDLDTSLTTGGLLLQKGDLAGAVNTWKESFEANPEHAKAAQAHLLYAYGLGKQYEAQAIKSRREAYIGALLAHRTKYPGGETTGEATFMLAQLEERRLQSSKALGYYNEIARDHPRRLDADVGLARCYENILTHLRRQQPQPQTEQLIQKWQAEAVQSLRSIVSAFPETADAWNRRQAEVALRFARILLNDRPTDFEAADNLLGRVLIAHAQAVMNPQELSPEEMETEQKGWNTILHASRQMRIFSLAGQNHVPHAQALVKELADKPVEVLAVVQGLSSLSESSTAQQKQQLGELQLFAVQLLLPNVSEFSEADQQRLQQSLAEAYVATNQPLKGLEIYERLREQFPEDRKLLNTVAHLLLRCGTDDCMTRGITVWRSIERNEKEGTPAWIEARYSVAWCICQLKRYDECLKLLTVTRLLYPELGGETWKPKFEELEKKCQHAKAVGSQAKSDK